MALDELPAAVQPHARGGGLEAENGRRLGYRETVDGDELHQRAIALRQLQEDFVEPAHLTLGIEALLDAHQRIRIDQGAARHTPDGARLPASPAVLVGDHVAGDAVEPGGRTTAPRAVALSAVDGRDEDVGRHIRGKLRVGDPPRHETLHGSDVLPVERLEGVGIGADPLHVPL